MILQCRSIPSAFRVNGLFGFNILATVLDKMNSFFWVKVFALALRPISISRGLQTWL